MYYLFDSMRNRTPTKSILLINSGSRLWDKFLRLLHQHDELTLVLPSMTTSSILEAVNRLQPYGIVDMTSTFRIVDDEYHTIRSLVDIELARRQINQ